MAGTLQDAIALVRQGQKLEARAILEALLRANPKDVSAWFWYAETLDTLEKRVHVLELCLKANPGNPQAVKALDVLRARLQPPAPAFGADEPASFNWDEPAPVAPVSDEPPMVWDDEPEEPSASTGIDWDEIERQQAPQPAYQPKNISETPAFEPALASPMIAKSPKPSFLFFEVWITALTCWNTREYTTLLDDPEAGQGRAYEWMAYIGLLAGLLSGLLVAFSIEDFLAEIRFLDLFDFFSGMDSILVIIIIIVGYAVFSCINAVFGLFANGLVQFLMSLFFGGSGSFSRTIYALAAYQAPYTIVFILLSAISMVVPFVSFITIFVWLYGLGLNVLALSAAHNMSMRRALMVVLLPVILLFGIGCLLLVFIMPDLASMLP
jgi:hypothetical protein